MLRGLLHEAQLAGTLVKGKWLAAGGVVLESLEDHRVWVIQVQGKGTWEFPKGRVEAGERIPHAAVREVVEESGIQAFIMDDGYLGAFESPHSVSHFFMMERVGGSPSQRQIGEVSDVRLVDLSEASTLLQGSREKAILEKVRGWVARRTRG